MWRFLHRCISLFAAIFIAYIAATGMLLALDDIVVRFSPAYPKAMLSPGLPPGMVKQVRMTPPALDLAAAADEFTRIEAAAKNAAPNRRLMSITLRGAGSAQVIATSTGPALFQFDPRTGAWLNPATAGKATPSPYIGSLRDHQIFKRLHRGDIFGVDGRYVIVAGDLAMLYLGISGIVMYFQMLGRRRRAGIRGWFW